MLRQLIITIGAIFFSAFVLAEKKEHQRLGNPDLKTSLEIFNMWGVQPETKQQILKYAYQYLNSDSAATMVSLAATSEFQVLCKNAGITHLGGPILGNISNKGASVWIRTLSHRRFQLKLMLMDERSYSDLCPAL